ncbi:ATP-binding cassette domain-containing protein [Rhizobium sp. 3T7]|uniref:ATP-binding cassette domain-containing protein n=1 Tax=Rhizobium sp. 3T7 TaxID=2874922 RepID=UPI001CCFF5F4|nr:ATP-binding cassette domain-containing protein [Rhizobium sp. 3T7]MBZ9791700.1 ATP-binding cassette domain-containing protein [Rhizobium sp. 3T7]
MSFDLAPSEALGIVSESGSGKTTVVIIVLGLVEPDDGTVFIDSEQWSNIPEARRRSRRASMLIAHTFDPRYTVEKIIS